MDTDSGQGETRRLRDLARLGALPPCVGLGALPVVAIVIVGRDIDRHIDAIEAWLKIAASDGGAAE